jgi:hypothetical protein
MGLESIPFIGGLFDDSDEKMSEEMRKAQEVYQNLSLPELKDYSPEMLQYIGDYNPEEAKYQTVSEDPAMRSMQMNALNRLSGLAEDGLSAVDEAGFENARQLGAQTLRSGTESALANAQARGVAGSGLEFAMREQAAQNAAQQSQNAALEQASASAKQRALYNEAFGNAAGNLRSQDFNVANNNADIINRFNQYNTGAANQAQQYNLGQRQDVSNTNVNMRNQAQLTNNDINQDRFKNQYRKADSVAGGYNDAARMYASQQAANEEKRKALGKGIGTALGAMVGGPAGASIGGTIGGSLG